jgi:hypothetical protein
MERVESDGRYWIQGATNGPPGRDDYFAGMREQFAKNPKASRSIGVRNRLGERRGAMDLTRETSLDLAP